MNRNVPAFHVFRRAVFCAATFIVLLLFPYSAIAQQPENLNRNDTANILYVPIPDDLSRQDVINGGPQIAARLRYQIRAQLAQHQVSAKESHPRTDRIVVFVDHDGQPIHAILEAPKAKPLVTAVPHTDLTFTYDSPDYPWTEDELALVTTTLNACYPLAKVIYGEPAFSASVNIEKNPYIGASGVFWATSHNQSYIAIESITSDVICHEMLHAFHADEVITLNAFEEGMVRAAEVEIFDRLPDFPHWDKYHSYYFDVNYEALNKKTIGSTGGNFFLGYVIPILRYQLAGYAWGKAVIENSSFFANFNREYYARLADGSTTQSDESTLVDIAATVLLSVEGRPFRAWYGLQAVFDTNPPAGYFLFNRGDGMPSFVVDYFSRDAAGFESMQTNAPVDWNFYDYTGDLIDVGQGPTSSYGWVRVPVNFPNYCDQRVTLVTTAQAPDGHPVTDTTQWVWGCSGVFGTVPFANTGTLTIDLLDDPTSTPFGTDVVNGAFSLPDLKTVRGRFLATFSPCSRCSEPTFRKYFNKDASDYFLIMALPGGVTADSIAPTTSIAASPNPNVNGWNNTSVTVTLNATDNPGGSGVRQIQFAIVGAQNSGLQTVTGNVASITISAQGTSVLSYFATDDAGNAEQTHKLTVKIDETPPVISGLPASGCSIWPPNHRMVQVATVTASDSLSGLAPGTFLITGTSNEPPSSEEIWISQTGSGSGSYSIKLQADRSGKGTGRVYTLTAAASDLAGNKTVSKAACLVPHDQRH